MYDGHDIGLFSGIFVFKEEIEKESPSFVRPELYEKALDFILKQNNEYKEVAITPNLVANFARSPIFSSRYNYKSIKF